MRNTNIALIAVAAVAVACESEQRSTPLSSRRRLEQ